MFTGLIERTGVIRRVSRGRGLVLEIAAEFGPPPLEDGESVAVNGVCLTVAHHDATRFTADILDETARKTTLGGILPGARVNLERALRVGDRVGGHIVQGHVDAIGTILARTVRKRDFQLRIGCARKVAACSVKEGSIAVNGVSLTLSDVGEDWLEVNVIPTTASSTTLGACAVGEAVNLETDILGRYACRPTQTPVALPAEGGLTLEMLAENGFLS